MVLLEQEINKHTEATKQNEINTLRLEISDIPWLLIFLRHQFTKINGTQDICENAIINNVRFSYNPNDNL